MTSNVSPGPSGQRKKRLKMFSASLHRRGVRKSQEEEKKRRGCSSSRDHLASVGVNRYQSCFLYGGRKGGTHQIRDFLPARNGSKL